MDSALGTAFNDEPEIIHHEFILELISSSTPHPALCSLTQRQYISRNGIIGFCNNSRQAQRVAAAAQRARYLNEAHSPAAFTCRDSHITWQLSEALPQILCSPAALAILLVEHAYSSLFFESCHARRVARTRRNGPSRRMRRFSRSQRLSRHTTYRRRSQRRRHKPPPLRKVFFPFCVSGSEVPSFYLLGLKAQPAVFVFPAGYTCTSWRCSLSRCSIFSVSIHHAQPHPSCEYVRSHMWLRRRGPSKRFQPIF